MSDLSPAVLPPSLLKPLPLPGASAATAFKGLDEATVRSRIDSTAKTYEQSFLSMMFGQMFEGSERTLFGGGAGEQAFTGFMTDAMAKAVERRGGVGLAKPLATEMLKLQGLAPKSAAMSAGAATSPAIAPPLASVKMVSLPTVDIAA